MPTVDGNGASRSVAPRRVGVLALQGAVGLHVPGPAPGSGAIPVEVRTAGRAGRRRRAGPPGRRVHHHLACCSSPPACSSRSATRLAAGMPAFGTCAGMILLADRRPRRPPRPAQLRRHRHRRAPQRLRPPGRLVRGRPRRRRVCDGPFHAVFIRAPVVERVGPGRRGAGHRHDSEGRPGLCSAARGRSWWRRSTRSCRATPGCTSCSWTAAPGWSPRACPGRQSRRR